MLQETISGKSVTKGKCFTNSATYSEGTIATYMSLNLFRLGDQKFKKTIMVFPGSEYTINFYDSESSNRKTLTGMVMEVFGDDRTNQYLLLKYKESVENKKQVLVGSCGCNLNNPSGSYDDYPVKTIPIQNIFDMQYGPNNPLSQPCECGESSCKGGWTTVLLGIDATLVKAVTINMKLLDDQCDNAVKYIEMKENGVYQIAYCKPGTSTVYEFDGRLTKIEPLENQTATGETGFVHCNCCTPSENVGVGGSIYTSSGYHCDTDHFMSDIGPWTDIQLTFDTSEMADGDFEIINLSWIRGVEDVTPDSPSPELPDNPGDDEMKCDCSCCANNILSKGITYYVNQEGISLKYYPLTNKMVSVSVDGTETEITGFETAFESILNPKEEPDPEPTDPENPDKPPIGEVEVTPGDDDW